MKKNKGFTLVEIMIVVAIIALLAAIAIPNLLRAKIGANDALAKGMLRSLSTASETYSTMHNGSYPTAMTDLTGATPPYITQNPLTNPTAGFGYVATQQNASGYIFTATPTTVGSSGSTVFTVSTGGLLQ